MQPLADSIEASSSGFLRDATRLKQTKHEHSLNDIFQKYDLTITMTTTYVDVGTEQPHPVLTPKDFVTMLSSEGKLDLLLCQHTGDDYLEFWEQWRLLQPDHPIFSVHRNELHSCIPMWCFADEGTSQKRRR